MLTGGGGNTAVFQHRHWPRARRHEELRAGARRSSTRSRPSPNKPITTIINTHTHGDHNGSNEFFGATVEFVAHENTKTNQEKMDAFKGDKSVFLPKKTFKDKLTLLAARTRSTCITSVPPTRTATPGSLFKRTARAALRRRVRG